MSEKDRQQKREEMDTNKDGEISAEERQAWKDANKSKEDDEPTRSEKRDQLEMDLFRSEYSWAYQLVQSNKELKELWETAIDKGWTAARFIAKFRDTKFYQNHLDSWLKIEALKQTKPLAYRDLIKGTAASLMDQAAGFGVKMTEAQARQFADTYLRRGFNEEQNRSAFIDWMTNMVSRQVANDPNGDKMDIGFFGTAGEMEDKLMASLSANGMDADNKYWRKWVNGQVISIIGNDTTIEDAIDYIRRTAASRYPGLGKDMIQSGKNLEDYAAGYMQTMAEVLEIDPAQINMRDSYIRKALTGYPRDKDGKGEPEPMTLYDFEVELKKDPRWKDTDNARNYASDMAMRIGQMFGVIS